MDSFEDIDDGNAERAPFREKARAQTEAKWRDYAEANSFRIRAPSPYPIDALGEIAGNASKAIEQTSRVPIEMAANSVLAVCAVAVQSVADVSIPDVGVKRCSLMIVTVADSGERKTASDNLARQPIEHREYKLRQERKAKMTQFTVDHAEWTREAKKIENGDAGPDTKKHLLIRLGEEPRPPREATLFVTDPTTEGLLKSFKTMPPSLALLNSEGGQIMNGASFKDERKISSAATFCTLWDGGTIRSAPRLRTPS
jgi:hypothetical protein